MENLVLQRLLKELYNIIVSILNNPYLQDNPLCLISMVVSVDVIPEDKHSVLEILKLNYQV